MTLEPAVTDHTSSNRVGAEAKGVSLRGVIKRYAGREGSLALNNVDLEVRPGEMLVLLGPSGCGKSTLLRSIAGLEDIDSGRIEIGGVTVSDGELKKHIPAHKRDIGLVFQSYSLWPHKTVQENVEFPLKARGLLRLPEYRTRASDVLRMVQCEQLANRYPSQLSGGQQQRVALGRALAAQPEVLLLDEPLSNLDALLKLELRAYLKQLHDEVRFTGVYVTHDQVEALNIADRIAVMSAGEILQIGTPENLYRHPSSAFVARFLGARNVLRVLAHADGGGCLTDAGPCVRVGEVRDLPVGAEVYFRPDEARIVSNPSAVREDGWLVSSLGIVSTLYGGARTEVILQSANGGRIEVSSRDLPQAAGESVSIFLPKDSAFVYQDEAAANV